MNSIHKAEFLSIPASHKDEMPLLLPVPDFLKQVFHSSKQRQGIVYLKYQLDYHGTMWYLNSPELAKVLGITLDGAYKMLRTFAKRGYAEIWDMKVLPVPARLSAHGLTYSKVREWVVIPERINALFYNKPKVEFMTTNNTIEGSTINENSPASIPPTFYNLEPKERGNQVTEWVKTGRKDLIKEFIAHDWWEPLPPTFYKLTPMDKVSQYQKWDTTGKWGLLDAFSEYIQRVRACLKSGSNGQAA